MNTSKNTLLLKFRQCGISLIELMIAMTLSLVLLGGVIQVFSASKASYRVQDGLSRLQENARFAMQYLTREVRMAGYAGCSNPNLIAPNSIVSTPPANVKFNPGDVVNGLNNTSVAGVKAGTDTLIVRYGSPNAISLSANMPTAADDLIIASNPDNLITGDYVLVTDCERSDLFKATSVSGSGSGPFTIQHKLPSNKTDQLSKIYRDDAAVMRFIFATYFINDSGRTDASGNTINSLFETTLTGTREIAEGIDDMQIVYGVDTGVGGTAADNAADQYLTAAGVGANWDKVVSARISLLVSTTSNASTQAEPYTDLQGNTQTPTDRRIRRTLTSTVSIRNRAP